MNYSYDQEVYQEVPGQISLALSISGCPINCKGCHSSETHSLSFGIELTENEFNRLLNKYKHTTCVLFYGGEWNIVELLKYIKIAKNRNLKVALYSGYNLSFFNKDFLFLLDYIKVGKYIEEKGGLSNPNTNQKFYSLKDGEIIKEILFHQN